MTLRLPTILALLLLPLAAAAQDLAPYEREAEGVMQRLRGAMMQEMQRAMAQGPAEAIGVCRHLAPQISAEIEAETGWTIRRPALKVRNREMRPTAEERSVMLGFEIRHAAGQPIELLRTTRAARDGDAVTIHFMQAIPTMQGCLACHGSAIEPETAAAIHALYPDDEAVGFEVGDLRGAFSLTKTVPAAAFAESKPAATVAPRLQELGYTPTDRPGARGDAARGTESFARHCQSCHAPDQLARHSFGSGDPEAGEKLCRKLETHGFTGREQDCDIVAFLNDLALFLAARP
ncbi:hypothetical protein GCM10017083_51570 [Thalassobaculum fulvum]|uniref:Cytochrome c domain-containing protein n=1 Tax=Thalassobaculum fulvum TaxID=1633335 RepID=A0A918XWZ2_9PROT|nr:DUF3365 domain-containing protein [Thalassobaculum fulvum]GHD62626.1 hypothetical protein GCM10017083_51570 [Thalassobaculum fulvum]